MISSSLRHFVSQSDLEPVLICDQIKRLVVKLSVLHRGLIGLGFVLYYAKTLLGKFEMILTGPISTVGLDCIISIKIKLNFD